MIDVKPACRQVIDLLSRVDDGQLADPTPCAEYAVGDLVDHLDEVSRGFTAVARKDTGERDDTDDMAAATGNGVERRVAVAERVRILGEAWDDPTAWHGSTAASDLEMPNELWGRIALTEMVVHGWDLATATGQPFDLPEETLGACLDHVATFVPNAPVPQLWGSAVDVPADAALIDRIVAITGRDPGRVPHRPDQLG